MTTTTLAVAGRWTPALVHTTMISAIVRRGLDAFVATPATEIPPPTAPADPDLPCRTFADVGAGIRVPTTDEDGFARPAWLQSLIGVANAWLPFHDELLGFPASPEVFLVEQFGKHLPNPHFRWPDLTDPANLATFVLQGIGAHRIERTPNGVALRMEFLSAIRVRPGLATYGGDAHVDEDGRLVALESGGRRVKPGDPDFAAEAFRFRSSVVTGVTLYDHLGTAHYGVANALLGATRRRLSPEHPLRIWLKPHTFRSGAANANATGSLLPDRGLVHRGTGFVDFAEARRGLVAGARYERLPDVLRSQGIHPRELPAALAARLPYATDGLDFWERVERYVHELFTESPALAGVLDGPRGDETRAFWDDLAGQLPGGLPPLDRAALPAVLTWVLFVVTGFHAHVGHVAPYVRDAAVVAGRPFAGATASDPQNSLQMAVVAAITGLVVPHVDGDLSHAMPDDGARVVYARFRAALAEHQEEVDARNARRPLPFPGFSPRVVPCSVSR